MKLNTGRFALLFTAIGLGCIFLFSGLTKHNRLVIDAPGYYFYLRAAFIYKDVKLDLTNRNPAIFKEVIFCNLTPDGQKIIKYTMGISVMLMPFFLIAHLLSQWLGYPATGYTLIYQNLMTIGVFLYLIAGLNFLRIALLKYFNPQIVAITLITLIAGTNLLWYATYEGFMSHSISFSLICACIYFYFNWLDKEKEKFSYLFFLMFALALLVRPLLLLTGVFFLVAGIIKNGGITGFVSFLKKQRLFWIINSLIVICVVSPQLIYYKYITGYWFYNGYAGEPFLWSKPETFNFLFSFRKGWLIYTPVMIFAFIGLIFLYKKKKEFFYGITLFLIIHIYILSAWWAWSYQESFGMRVMIDYYGILSFPIAAAFTALLNAKKIYAITLYSVLSLFIILNIFQSWQYKHGYLHSEFMTKEAYFKGFLQTKPSNEWYDLLKAYNYDLRKKGLPQIEMNKKYFEKLPSGELVYFRSSYNLNFISITNRFSLLECDSNILDKNEVFYFIKLGGDTFALKALNDKFISHKPEYNNLFLADKDRIGINEKFILNFIDEGDNKVQMKTLNHQYISIVEKNNQTLIMAKDYKQSQEGIFRIYHLYQL